MTQRFRIAIAAAAAAAISVLASGQELAPTRYELVLSVDFHEERIQGSARVTIENRGQSPAAEASFLLYRLLTVSAVGDGAGASLAFSQNVVAFDDDPRRQANQLRVLLAPALSPGERRVVDVAYGGFLAGYVETGALYIQDRVSEDFTILREDADAYPTLRPPSYAKIRAAALPEFDYLARITVPETHVVANGGRLVERTVRDGRATYVYTNLRPAWRMDFAIARFRTLDAPGLRVFALPVDTAGAERVLRASSAAMDLFGKWFGPRPVAAAFTIIEIPDGWGSQTDVTSILQSAAAFRDAAKIDEVYHEVSHLWNVPANDRPSCRWEEGLASFLGALAQERLDGGPSLDSRADRTLSRLRQRLAAEPRLRSVPMLAYGREQMTSDSYRTGMILFYVLYRIVGPQRFEAVLRDYDAAYTASGGTTMELVRRFEAVGGKPSHAPSMTGSGRRDGRRSWHRERRRRSCRIVIVRPLPQGDNDAGKKVKPMKWSPEQIATLFAYTRWASEKTLESVAPLSPAELLRAIGGSFGSVQATLVHLYGADWVWLERWHGRSPKALPKAEELESFDALRSRWREVQDGQRALVETMTPARMDESITYVNFAGQTWTYRSARPSSTLPTTARTIAARSRRCCGSSGRRRSRPTICAGSTPAESEARRENAASAPGRSAARKRRGASPAERSERGRRANERSEGRAPRKSEKAGREAANFSPRSPRPDRRIRKRACPSGRGTPAVRAARARAAGGDGRAPSRPRPAAATRSADADPRPTSPWPRRRTRRRSRRQTRTEPDGDPPRPGRARS